MKFKSLLFSLVVAIFSFVASPSTAQTFTGPGPMVPNQLFHDAALAVGPNHVVAAVPHKWSVYDKSGNLIVNHMFTNWWGNVSGEQFGGRAYYDESGHYVLLATSNGNGLGYMYLSVSQTDDPTGLWWNYVFDWSLDNGVYCGQWGENPDLGFDDNSVFITANQFPLSGVPFFSYAKIRVLSKAQLFSGDPNPTWADFTQLKNEDGSYAFGVRPSRSVGSSASAYFLNNRQGGGSAVTLWRMDNSSTTPTLTRNTVPIRTHSTPQGAPQAGGRERVWVSDCRLQNVIHRDGVLYTAFTESFGTTKQASSAVRYLEIGTSGTLGRDITVAGSSTKIGLYYPVVGVDGLGNVALAYNRSSSTENISFHYAKKATGAATFGPSLSIRNGTTYLPNPIWGHYNAMHNDGNKLWFLGGVATTVPFTTVITGVTLP